MNVNCHYCVESITILETTYLVNNLCFLSLDITMFCLKVFYVFFAFYLCEALALAPSASEFGTLAPF